MNRGVGRRELLMALFAGFVRERRIWVGCEYHRHIPLAPLPLVD
ncbi:MAG: hypothetical protein ACON4K_07310 [Akkermansiaceae bacterium]